MSQTEFKNGLAHAPEGDPHIVILGTLPGDESIRSGKYYEDERNDFWKILDGIWEGINSPSYKIKMETLQKNHIILWDVLKSAEREGSGDRAIINPTPNNFNDLFSKYKNINLIIFNGKSPYKWMKKRQIRELLDYNPKKVRTLPSSSRSNTHKTLKEKTEEWKKELKDF